MIWVALAICILGAIASLAFLSVDFSKAWDLAQSLKQVKKRFR